MSPFNSRPRSRNTPSPNVEGQNQDLFNALDYDAQQDPLNDPLSIADALPPPPTASVRPRTHRRTLTSTSPHRMLPPLFICRNERRCDQDDISPQHVTLPSSTFTSSQDIKFKPSPTPSPQLSPKKEMWSFLPGLKSTTTSRPASPTKSDPKPHRIADWFQGESDPVTISVLPSPSKEKSNQTPCPSTLTRPTTATSCRKSTAATPTSLFASIFRTGTSSSHSPTSGSSQVAADSLLTLDPHSILHTTSTDPSTSALDRALALLVRFQTAYRASTRCAADATAELDALAEELAEARTRAAAARQQVEALAVRLEEREECLRELQREKEVRRRSVRLLTSSEAGSGGGRDRDSVGSAGSLPSMVGDEEEDDAEAGTRRPVDGSGSSVVGPETPRTASPVPSARSRGGGASRLQDGKVVLEARCVGRADGKAAEERNPSGSAGDADLKAENETLKSRVRYLEREMDGCLDLVRGLGGGR